MIKKFIQRRLGKGEPGPDAAAPPAAAEAVATVTIPLGERVEVAAADHGIDLRLLDDNAVRVVRTLKEAGYEAYIVGGAVRDLLVGLRPKDFDVATDATPEQVKVLFRRAFIIGRRFRLVHVVFGRGREHETIEVSTFRAFLDSTTAEQVLGNEKTAKGELAGKTGARHVVDASGRVLRDNVWGPQIEDAARRDFTINAMYYDPLTQVLVDYHGGLGDARARVLRMIGDPLARYREDPVRIVRLLRFAAKLGFDIEPGTAAPITTMAPKLADVPTSRLFDEMVKLLQTGHAVRSVEVLRQHGLLAGVFPVLEAALNPARPSAQREAFVQQALANTDARVADGRSVVPSFLLACLLWHDVQERWSALRDDGEASFPALQQAVDSVFERRIGDISGRGKLAADMREIWFMQPRFEKRTPAGAQGLAAQPRFRAGFDFLRLRADVGELPVELADWWEDYHLGSDDDRAAMVEDLRSRQHGSRVKRVPKAAPVAEPAGAPPAAEPGSRADAEATEDGDAPESSVEGSAVGDDAPRKRRRRRRRPGGRGTAGGNGPAAGEGGGGGEGGSPA
ncbi:MAG: polynucleotide adenylyltransferase PcnB [Rubrivivax sp.]|nr:polynucleotide adenylyltransferase PcnB [Rubrivivax sp.]